MKVFDNRTAYTLLLWLLLPYALLHLWWRGRRQPEYRQHIAERFGRYALPRRDRAHKPLIWLHTVSVGETRAAATLVGELRALSRSSASAHPHHAYRPRRQRTVIWR